MNKNTEFLSGNEAIAHAAYRAGCKVAAAYPGTPSTEILENIAKFKDSIYCEWSVNEKVAMEVAIGASFAGTRALAVMKHVGLNVASDPLMTFSYVGANGGMVIITADDPGMHSSQNEQDNRFYAKLAKVPLLEPSDSQEAYDMTVEAFVISEEFNTPVILRMTTRTSHASGIVDLGDFTPLPPSGRTYVKDVEGRVTVPAYARKMRFKIDERMNTLRDFSESTRMNRIERSDTDECSGRSPCRPSAPAGPDLPLPRRERVGVRGNDLGIITSGISYQYVKEVFPEASVLKLGFTNPLPKDLIRRFAESVRKLYVIEELDPFLEEQVRALGVKVEDHLTQLHIGELNPYRLRKLRSEILEEPAPEIASKGVGEGLPARPPVLCAGCGHRSVFRALGRLGATVMGDIGCYSLGAFKPLESLDSIVCMGASIGNAFGMEKAGYKNRMVAILGDSTFFHSGITGLLNIVYNRGASTVIVLDNRTTAMTGHQEHPGTGRTLMGEQTKEITVEQVARGIGVERVRVIDCYDLAEVEQVIKEEIETPEPSMIVAKRPCIIGSRIATKRQFVINSDACKGCRACLKLGCPAMELGEADPDKPKLRKVKINPVLCVGCSMCLQTCTRDAVEEKILEEMAR